MYTTSLGGALEWGTWVARLGGALGWRYRQRALCSDAARPSSCIAQPYTFRTIRDDASMVADANTKTGEQR